MQIPFDLAKKGTQFTINRYQKIFNKQFLADGTAAAFTTKIFCFIVNSHWCDIDNFTKMTDKLEVRTYVADQIGCQYLNEVAWVGSKAEDAPLHNYACGSWIFKTNHGSGGHQVIRQNLLPEVRNNIKKSLMTNYYFASAEPQYFFIKPKAFIEKLVEGINDKPPVMLRLWCFKGLVVLIQADDGSPISPFYSRQWRDMKISRLGGNPPRLHIDKPKNLAEVILVAEKLSMPFDFVRVDLYNQCGKIRFSELTFTPLAGSLLFEPRAWDYKLGQIWSQRGGLSFA